MALQSVGKQEQTHYTDSFFRRFRSFFEIPDKTLTENASSHGWQGIEAYKEMLRLDGKLTSLQRKRAGAVASLGAVIERYPELKSQPVVAKLERELKAIEEKIGHGRTVYNEAVREYNDNVMSFPRMLLARLCGFGPHRFFEATGSR